MVRHAIIPLPVWGVISANINFQILLCHSPMLLCSFLRNSYMHVRILLFPFEFCYLLFWFYYAIMNSFIQFWILLFAFELCYAVVQFCNSIVQSSDEAWRQLTERIETRTDYPGKNFERFHSAEKNSRRKNDWKFNKENWAIKSVQELRRAELSILICII